jgi:FKBP-type peptidyl-prolyl cis-trans isomerase SlyD
MENKYYKVAYKLYTIEDGERDFAEEAPAEEPFEFITGLGLAIEAFEKKMEALVTGDKFDFVIPQNEAYGEYDETHVVELPKSTFFIDGKFDDEHVQEGAIIPLISADGDRFSAVVNEIKENVVEVDLNHPLAGCDLNFIGEVIEARPATAEEIAAVTAPAGCSGCEKGKKGCNCEGGCEGCS